jgi:hypothetical protein
MAYDYIRQKEVGMSEPRTWQEMLTALLDEDVWLLRSFARMREHPCWDPIIKLLKEDESAVARLIGYLYQARPEGLWALVLLPLLTGEDLVPPDYECDMCLARTPWEKWSVRKGIEPILE